VQKRAVAAVRIAAKMQPGCRKIGGEAEHLDAGGTGGFCRQPELERGVSGGGDEAPEFPGGRVQPSCASTPHPQHQTVGVGRLQWAAGHRGGRGTLRAGDRPPSVVHVWPLTEVSMM
jgi:hypothetical protein